MPAIADDPNGLINACETGPRVATGVRAKIPFWLKFRLECHILWPQRVLRLNGPGAFNSFFDKVRGPHNPSFRLLSEP